MRMPSKGREILSPDHSDAALLAACCVALATLTPVALFQTRVIKSLPDVPLKFFASEAITSSPQAHPLGIPDGLLGIASFGTTLALILRSRQRAQPSKLLGAKLAFDAGTAAFNFTRQIVSFGKLCSWCTGTALAAGVMAYSGRRIIWNTGTRAQESLLRAPSERSRTSEKISMN